MPNCGKEVASSTPEDTSATFQNGPIWAGWQTPAEHKLWQFLHNLGHWKINISVFENKYWTESQKKHFLGTSQFSKNMLQATDFLYQKSTWVKIVSAGLYQKFETSIHMKWWKEVSAETLNNVFCSARLNKTFILIKKCSVGKKPHCEHFVRASWALKDPIFQKMVI